MTKKPKRTKHVPQRTCAGCREVHPKRTMTRIVRTADGIRIDNTGKLAGRGAYLHDQLSCWERGLKGSLAAALKTEFTEQDLELLNAYKRSLPDTDQAGE